MKTRTRFALLSLLSVAGLGLGVASSSFAQSRARGDCRTAWSRSVRSYLTQNRTSAPDGRVPKNLDEEELVAQAWLEAFAPACQMAQEGRKEDARVEAAAIGAQVLARLDARACVKFMNAYMQSSRAKSICDSASGGDGEKLRTMIGDSIPPR